MLVISHEMRRIEFIPVDYHESSNVCGSGEASVQASHDKPEDSLEEDTDRQTVSWADPIAGEGSDECARDIKEIDNGIPRRDEALLAPDCMRRGVEWYIDSGHKPAKTLPQRSGARQDQCQPSRRIDAKGVCGKVVDEPDQRDDREAEPIEFDNQPDWILVHLLPVVLFWLL